PLAMSSVLRSHVSGDVLPDDPAAQPRRVRLPWVLLALACAMALALAARWSWGAKGEGPAFRPQPDALEYAASAQALAQTGRYFLQVGPLQSPPHYSPGWPGMLSAALRLGTDPKRLWFVTGSFGALLCALIGGAVVSLVVRAESAPLSAATGWITLVAGA